MKNLVFVASSFFTIATLALSATSMASGFICSGQGYNVKLYNHVQPSRGTKNAAVLVVSTDSSGVIAKLQGEEIEKTQSEKAITYKGLTHDLTSGHFTAVRLDIVKAASTNSGYEGAHFAWVTVTVDKQSFKGNLACSEYLKGRH